MLNQAKFNRLDEKQMELDILMVIAEIAVALAGFSAIVANFSKDWTAAKSEQLVNLLTQSGIALFAAMVPLVMSLRVIEDEGSASVTLWSISSAGYILVTSGFLVRDLYHRNKKSGPSTRMDTFIFLIFLFAIAAQVYNLYVGAQAWIYLLALLLSIAYAFVSFTLLIQPFITDGKRGDTKHSDRRCV